MEAPARIDMAGGWTDTPPISYEAGLALASKKPPRPPADALSLAHSAPPPPPPQRHAAGEWTGAGGVRLKGSAAIGIIRRHV